MFKSKGVTWVKFIQQILKSNLKYSTEMDLCTWTLWDLQGSPIWGKRGFGVHAQRAEEGMDGPAQPPLRDCRARHLRSV